MKRKGGFIWSIGERKWGIAQFKNSPPMVTDATSKLAVFTWSSDCVPFRKELDSLQSESTSAEQQTIVEQPAFYGSTSTKQTYNQLTTKVLPSEWQTFGEENKSIARDTVQSNSGNQIKPNVSGQPTKMKQLWTGCRARPRQEKSTHFI